MRRRAILSAFWSIVLLFGARFASAGQDGCVADPHTLCLNNNRFAVSVVFRTADTGPADATGVELTADSGYFWFFNPANIEVVVKVLNACTINDSYWVFATGLTNVEVTISVTDTESGTLKTYVNQLGTAFAPVQDTSAFPACP